MMRVTRSTMNISKLIVFTLLIILLLGCRSQQTNQHKLLIYTPHAEDMLRDFVARYKQAYPEVEVQFLDMGSREVLERCAQSAIAR